MEAPTNISNRIQEFISNIPDVQLRAAVQEIKELRATGVLPRDVVTTLARQMKDEFDIDYTTCLDLVQTGVMQHAAFLWAGSGQTQSGSQVNKAVGGKQNFLARRLGEILIEVANQPNDYKGMVVSASGVLTHGARALKEMAVPLKVDGVDITEAHEERLMESQPGYHAVALEQMATHLAMLKKAVESGDTERVARIIRLYVFD